MSSFRPEATGMYSALLFTSKIGRKCEMMAQVEGWTDNLALVQRLDKMIQFNPPTLYSKNDSDLISGIWQILRNVKLKIQHVKGHQDESGKALSRKERPMNLRHLNCKKTTPRNPQIILETARNWK